MSIYIYTNMSVRDKLKNYRTDDSFQQYRVIHEEELGI